MSAEQSPPSARNDKWSHYVAFGQWLVFGAAGVALLFVVGEQLPQRIKLPVFFMMGLESIAAWGLGRWGAQRSVCPGISFVLASWLIIASGDVLIAVKTYQDGVRTMRSQKQWQAPVDPISRKFKESLEKEPEGETQEERRNRLAILAQVERGEAMHKQRLEYLTFYGYLANRIPKEWGQWKHPWPAIFWGTEILIGSTIGAWFAAWTLRAASPRETNSMAHSNTVPETQGGHG